MLVEVIKVSDGTVLLHKQWECGMNDAMAQAMIDYVERRVRNFHFDPPGMVYIRFRQDGRFNWRTWMTHRIVMPAYQPVVTPQVESRRPRSAMAAFLALGQ